MVERRINKVEASAATKAPSVLAGTSVEPM
jgi:hypothetical protein